MRWRFVLALTGGLLGVAPLAAADPKPDAPKKFAVPYRLTDTKHVMVRVKINGKGPFNMIMDTGAPAVFITKAVAKKAKVDAEAKGLSDIDRFELEGGVVVEKTRCRVEDLFQLDGMNAMGLAGVELHGVIGYNVLAKYKIQYDFTSDKLVLEPLPGFEPPPLVPIGGGKGQGGLESLGPMMKMLAALTGIKPNFTVVPRGFVGLEYEEKDDAVIVTRVLPDSPAAMAGFKVGDRIQAIKNTDIDSGKDLARALAKAGVGTRLKFKVKRGSESETLTVELGKGL